MTTAIVIGAGASAAVKYPLVVTDYPFAIRVAANAGLLFGVPDYWCCVDDVASRRWYEAGLAAQSLGCKLVTLARSEPAARDRQLTHYDRHIVDASAPYRPFRLTGLFAIQFTLAEVRATELHLVGLEGYPHPDDGPAYFDCAPWYDSSETLVPQSKLATKTLSVIQPEMQAICEAWPSARFVCHGRPNYTVVAPNWRVDE